MRRDSQKVSVNFPFEFLSSCRTLATSLACPQSRVLCKSHIGEVFRSGCTFTRGSTPSQSDLRRSFLHEKHQNYRYSHTKTKGMKKLANEAQTPVTEKTDLKAQLAEVAERIRTMREIIGSVFPKKQNRKRALRILRCSAWMPAIMTAVPLPGAATPLW